MPASFTSKDSESEITTNGNPCRFRQVVTRSKHVTTGNPYSATIANLQKQGVDIEECAYSMGVHHWGNDNLLPGVQVTTGAVGRIVELTQQGYVQIQP
jgi:intracellular sulfur oxidation DsrE/DsrF family protein